MSTILGAGLLISRGVKVPLVVERNVAPATNSGSLIITLRCFIYQTDRVYRKLHRSGLLRSAMTLEVRIGRNVCSLVNYVVLIKRLYDVSAPKYMRWQHGVSAESMKEGVAK